MQFVVAVLLVTSLNSANGFAGWLGDALLGAGTGLGDRAIRETADKGYERARGAITRREEAKKEGKNEAGGQSGKEPPVDEIRSTSRVSGGGGTLAGKNGIRPEDVLSKYDFVPGDRVIFHDDFSDTDVGEFPRRWTLSGPDGSFSKAPVEVVQFEGRRWARYRPSNEDKDVSSSFYIRLNIGKNMPEKFTVEFDAVLPPYDGRFQHPEYRVLLINHGSTFQGYTFRTTKTNVVRIGSCGASAGSTELRFERGDGQIHRVAIRVNGTSAKAYLDGEVVANDPEGIARPITVIGVELAYRTGARVIPLMFTDFRVAAGGNDILEGRAENRRVEVVNVP